ncbi:mediator of RNA polymerase II transcription subunit 9-like [Gossypium arboreum]|nr:mediator of RNA polymerase II transcription subunit 9-like [Gossypium arboreum]
MTMDTSAGGGSWTTIPSVPPHSNVSTPSNQDPPYLSPPPPSQQEVQQDQHHQSLPSHFHLLHLVENLGDAIDNGTRNQHSDDLINELNNHFEKCQQLLNSIGASINTKPMTVEGQKQKLEESEQLLNQRRDLIANCRSSVEDLVKTEP